MLLHCGPSAVTRPVNFLKPGIMRPSCRCCQAVVPYLNVGCLRGHFSRKGWVQFIVNYIFVDGLHIFVYELKFALGKGSGHHLMEQSAVVEGVVDLFAATVSLVHLGFPSTGSLISRLLKPSRIPQMPWRLSTAPLEIVRSLSLAC